MAYKHKEAFALMWYRCDACGHTERFWNSRDGVTPFGGVRCPSCGLQGLHGGLSHFHFHLDECVPDHKPHPGQRIWRDGTDLEAKVILERRFAAFEARGQAVPQDVREKMIAEIGQPTSEFQPGWPMWVRVSEGAQRYE
jgi:DNA-directed RNA polymerase subunit RPC12/RpoP